LDDFIARLAVLAKNSDRRELSFFVFVAFQPRAARVPGKWSIATAFGVIHVA